MRATAIGILLLALCSLGGAAPLKLIPTPQQVELLPGAHNLKSSGVARAKETPRLPVEQLLEELRSAKLTPGLASTMTIVLGDRPSMTPYLKGQNLTVLDDKGPEAYFLLVEPRRVIVAGNGPAGTFYGVQTLKQLIRANRTGVTIPCCRILDWPGLKYRGYSDDISRGPIPTMDFLMRQIRTLAEFKMNLLTLYTEHVFKLQKYPFIAPDDGLTAEQVKQLSAYAKQYHMELVGNFQSFGHMGNILRHPQLANLRETGGIICPVKEESYQFLDDVYSEVATAYDSPLFNVNCDETYGLGEGPSKELAAKIGVGGVYVQHMIRIHDILKDKYHKRMMMWGDIALEHPEIVQRLPKDTILLSWGYEAAKDYDRAIDPFVKAGFEFMVCPGVSCWSQIFPNYEKAAVNIQNYVRDGAKFGALGMLNTTWDDDGENLFHWNFYGTNWGAACAWRPADTSREDFDAAYAAVSYGTPNDKLTRAIRLLSGCVKNPLTQGNRDPAFWVRPFTVLATSYDSVMKQATELTATTDEALALLREARAQATTEAADLDYLIFAARRLQYLGRARQLQFTAAKRYSDALQAFPDTKPAAAALDSACQGADEMVKTISDLRAEYQRLWLLENRPWALDRPLGKYDGLLKDLTAHQKLLSEARAKMQATGVPPDPAAVGLRLVETGRRSLQAVPTAEALLPEGAKWWDDRWPSRVPLRVKMAGNVVADYPVAVPLSFGEQKIAPDSVRVVEYAAAGTGTPLLTQYEPVTPNSGRVVFVLPGATAAQAARNFAVYYDLDGSPPKPAQPASALQVKAAGGGYWVENERYRVFVGRNGAHLFDWLVKALGNLNLPQPGHRGWQGFADSGPEDRDGDFNLQVEAAGPVQVRLQGLSGTGSNEKVFLFTVGQPYVEVLLARPVGFYWDYDNPDNFAADKGHPGTALFSSGLKQPVCRSDETIHGVGQGTYWCAKTREDGLVLANLTPEVQATHMTGPGGGWGGVGIEGSVPASHFVTFADQVSGDPTATLNAVQRTLDMRQQPSVWVSKPQSR